MRVIAGAAGGRRLEAPKGPGTRPTSDRVREALFSALAPWLAGARVLDLYAGSGALGIEALSRGAASAVLVERDRRAAAVISRNLERSRLEGGVVRVVDVARYCRDPADGPFDLVLADPPYDTPSDEVAGHIAALVGAGALAPGATLIVERRAGDPGVEAPPGVTWARERAYGDTVLLWGHGEE